MAPFRAPIMSGPDRGWSWVIAFAACFTSFVLAGIFRSSGVLFVAFIASFGVTREEAAWPMVVCISVLNFTGPISGILGSQYGIRPVVIIGSVIGAIGVTSCFFTTSLTVVTVLFGGVFGFGYGLVSTLVPVIVNSYFLNKKATANGIANSGSCFGSIFFPVLYEYLLEDYGLSGCFLITGGVILNIVVAGALFRPPPFTIINQNASVPESYWKGKDGNTSGTNHESIALLDPKSTAQKNLQAELSSAISKRNNDGPENRRYKSSISCDESSTEDGCFELRRAEKEFQDSLNGFQSVALDIVTTSQSDEVLNRYDASQTTEGCPARYSFSLKSHGSQFKSPIPNSGPLKKCNYRLRYPSGDNNSSLCPVTEDVSLKTDIRHIDETAYRIADGQTAENIQSLETEIRHTDWTACRVTDGQTAASFRFFVTVFTSPLFHLTAFTNVTFYFIFHMYVNVIVDYAGDGGTSPEDAKYILFAFSMADLFGRLCLGWVTDQQLMSRSRFVMSAMMGISLVFLVLPFASDYWSLMAVSCCYGVFLGSSMILFPILLDDFLGTRLHAVAYGCLCFMNGSSSLIRPFVIGYFRDTIGSYEHIFYLLGCISFLASATWLFEKCISPHHRHQLSRTL